MAWSSSNRRARLPRDWPARRAAVRDRAQGACEAETHHPHCTGIGAECDHRIANDDHSLTNLQWLSVACHAAKTAAESARARESRRAALRLPHEGHPGAMNKYAGPKRT